jgi:hypothetical protein
MHPIFPGDSPPKFRRFDHWGILVAILAGGLLIGIVTDNDKASDVRRQMGESLSSPLKPWSSPPARLPWRGEDPSATNVKVLTIFWAASQLGR